MAIEDDIDFLESVPLLRLLGRPALRILAIGAESRYVHGGEVLFERGEPADAGYLIQEGSFRLSARGADNPQDMLVGPGTLLGELALINDNEQPFTATANEPSTIVRISRSLFVKCLEGYPDAARALRDYMARRVDRTVQEFQKVGRALDPGARR